MWRCLTDIPILPPPKPLCQVAYPVLYLWPMAFLSIVHRPTRGRVVVRPRSPASAAPAPSGSTSAPISPVSVTGGYPRDRARLKSGRSQSPPGGKAFPPLNPPEKRAVFAPPFSRAFPPQPPPAQKKTNNKARNGNKQKTQKNKVTR